MNMLKLFSYKVINNTKSLQIFHVFLSWLINYDGLRIEYFKTFHLFPEILAKQRKHDLGWISDVSARVPNSEREI